MTSQGFCVKIVSKCDDSAGQECIYPRGDEMDAVNVIGHKMQDTWHEQLTSLKDRANAGTLGLSEG
jgi:hypothetical protein